MVGEDAHGVGPAHHAVGVVERAGQREIVFKPRIPHRKPELFHERRIGKRADVHPAKPQPLGKEPTHCRNLPQMVFLLAHVCDRHEQRQTVLRQRDRQFFLAHRENFLTVHTIRNDDRAGGELRIFSDRPLHRVTGGEEKAVELRFKAQNVRMEEGGLVHVRVDPDVFAPRRGIARAKRARKPLAVGNGGVVVLPLQIADGAAPERLRAGELPFELKDRLFRKRGLFFVFGCVDDVYPRRNLRNERETARQVDHVKDEEINVEARAVHRAKEIHERRFRAAPEELVDDKKDALFLRYGSAHARIYSPHTASASPSMRMRPCSSQSAFLQIFCTCSIECETKTTVAPEAIISCIRAKLFSWNL